jgi:hypothetical protein
MPTFLGPMKISGNELERAVIHNLNVAPSNPVPGQLFYDKSTVPGVLYYFNGSGWKRADNVGISSETQTVFNQLNTKSEVLSNKTLNNTNVITVKDTNLTVQDDQDTTKQAKIQASSISTNTTRTYTLPDKNGTIALTSDLTTTSFNTTNISSAGSYNVSSTDTVIFANGAVDANVYLPAPATAGSGKSYIIKNIAGGHIDVFSLGGGLIDNKTTVSLTSLSAINVISDGTKWWIY